MYDLFPYVWEMLGTLHLLNGFVEWLGCGYYKPVKTAENLAETSQSPPRRDSKDESAGSEAEIAFGMEEPWQYKGGLGSELQQQLPLDTGQDLFTMRPPYPPGPQFYSVRPYREKDRPELMRLCEQQSFSDETTKDQNGQYYKDFE